MEDGGSAVVGFVVEGHDFPFPVHDKPQGHALHPSGAELRLDFPPEHGREFESHKPVENAAGLLGVDKVHVYRPGRLDGLADGFLGYFVEDYPPGAFDVEAKGLGQMPGNGFSFAVFIGCQPYSGSGREFLQV